MLKTLLKYLHKNTEATTEVTTEKTDKGIPAENLIEIFSGCPWCSAKISTLASRQLRFECGQEYVKDIGEIKWRQSGTWLDVCCHIKQTLNDRAKNAKFKFTVEI